MPMNLRNGWKSSYGRSHAFVAFETPNPYNRWQHSPIVLTALALALVVWASGFTLFQTNAEIASQTYETILRAARIPFSMIALLVVVNFLLKNNIFFLVRSNVFVVMLYALAALSIAYAPVKRQTFDQFLLLFEFTIMIGAFSISAGSPRRCLSAFSGLLMLMLFSSFFAVFVRPDAGIHVDGIYNREVEDVLGAWRGIYWHKNTAGVICALTFVLIYCYRSDGVIRSVILRYLVLFWTFVFLIFSECETAFVATAFAISFFYFLKIFRRYATLIASTISIIIASIFCLFSYIVVLHYDSNVSFSFSNRVTIWQLYYEYWMLSPIFGHGYAGVFLPLGGGISSFRGGWEASMPHAHNGYIDVLSQLGLLGLVALFLAISTSIRAGIILSGNKREGEWALPATALLLVCLFTGLMEAVVMTTRFVWVFAALLMFMLNGVYVREMMKRGDEPRVAGPLSRPNRSNGARRLVTQQPLDLR